MVFRISLVALLTAAFSTVSMAQAVTAESTITESKETSLFPGSSLSLWNYVDANDTAAGGDTTFAVEPHFNFPVLNKMATLDIYGKFSMGTNKEEGRAHIQEPAGAADLQKVFIDNDYVTLDPYVTFGNLFSGESVTVTPTFSVALSMPTVFEDFKLTPYFLNESAITFYTGSKEEKVGALQNGRTTRALTPEEAEVDPTAVVNVDKAPIATYTRIAVSLEPNATQGLKVTLGANLLADKNNTPIFDSIASKKITGYSDKWEVKTQPMFRVDYKINDQLSFRNTTTVDMQDGFERPTADQKAAGAVSNVSRLIYTLY